MWVGLLNGGSPESHKHTVSDGKGGSRMVTRRAGRPARSVYLDKQVGLIVVGQTFLGVPMRLRLSWFFILLVVGGTTLTGNSFAKDFTGGLDPDLWIVRSAGGVRVIVFRECSPEHCSTTTYLQWLTEGWKEGVDREYPVVSEGDAVLLKEANFVGAFVEDVGRSQDSDQIVFLLDIGNTYSSEHRVRLQVYVEGNGKYKAEEY